MKDIVHRGRDTGQPSPAAKAAARHNLATRAGILEYRASGRRLDIANALQTLRANIP